MRKQLCGRPAGATSRHVSFPHKHKVEALNSALRKLGTQEGLGSQWCNRLPSIAREVGGERGCGRYVFSASYLAHPPLDQHLPTNKRTDR
jgi:hypothetical protein